MNTRRLAGGDPLVRALGPLVDARPELLATPGSRTRWLELVARAQTNA